MNRFIEIAKKFDIHSEPIAAIRWGKGHINDTLLIDTKSGERYILQRINQYVFNKPDEVMSNIMKVTDYLRKKIIEDGGNPNRETLRVILTKDGKPLYYDENGDPWRVYIFVHDTVSFEKMDNKEDFYGAGTAFGNFAKRLVDFPAEELYETIPKFHDMPDRYKNYEKSVLENRSGRAKNVQREIELCNSFKQYSNELDERLKKGQLSLRVTHNDTKPNNILFDIITKKPVCVVDLDTVMPGLTATDFANSIRYGANYVAEDSKDYEHAGIDLDLYRYYTQGYLDECGDVLTETEVKMLPVGARMMSIENAIRFLGDYIDGDIYFKTAYEEHNLDRARTQIWLVLDMLKKWDQMYDILYKIYK